MKVLPILFSILILLFTVRPDLSSLGLEMQDSCCEQTDCHSNLDGETDSESEKRICNPFQCHTCCFVHLQKIPEIQWLKVIVEPEHHTPLLVNFPAEPDVACWQPPRIA